jgi:competence ComEA-like helix-hairpin-helix protein
MARMMKAIMRLVLVACVALAAGALGAWAQDGGATPENKLINPNNASVEMLAKIPGLNENIAKEIIIMREQMGDFQNLDDLLEVKGVTKELLEEIKPYTSVDPAKTDCTC